MSESGSSAFNYAATYWTAERTFRLRRSLPLVAEFFAMRYRLELLPIEHTAGSVYLAVRLPWNDANNARRLAHVRNIRELYVTGYDVECGSLAEIFLLRLARQGDADELAGPHCKLSSRPR